MTDADKHYFHFTFGPVQGFVSQARRTRDFWAGSFLLSWLAGVAMAEVRRQGGTINFPIPPSDYLQWITEGKGQFDAPRQGGIPNRFKAFSARVPGEFDGALVAQSIRDAWLALADHVWKCDHMDNVAAKETRAIWLRQNSNFWEISWVITKDANDTSVMDQRKNWRTHYPARNEPGVKCMMMDGWQELSGSARPASQVARFWEAVRHGQETDFADGEMLCSIAYVKRRFVRSFEEFSTVLPSGLHVHGWKLESGMPSVSFVAAVHWLEGLVRDASDQDIDNLLASARSVNPRRDEWSTRMACLQEAAGRWSADNPRRQLLALDGNLFFRHVHENPRAYDYPQAQTRELARVLALIKSNRPQGAAPLSPFYAIVLMDGDSLGSHMTDPAKQKPISDALNHFTQGVPALVERHNGFLIYAGGDDVLALLPVEDALPCAAAVRQCYLESFRASKIPTTISAAVNFVHVKTPLGKALANSHALLDDVAKDGTGRDALAVRVWKPGGMALEWAQPWRIALAEGNVQKTAIEELAEKFRNARDSADARFTSKFFFKIEQQFSLLNPPAGSTQSILNEAEACALLAVNFVASADNANVVDLRLANEIIAPLLRQCRAVRRELDQADASKWSRSQQLRVDGALLMRFLAEKGVEQ